MISLTRLSGSVFALNPDLIERIDHTPDTVITLADGSKYVVAESLAGVVDIISHHRAEIVALSGLISVGRSAFEHDSGWPSAPAANISLLGGPTDANEGPDARREGHHEPGSGRPALSVVTPASTTTICHPPRETHGTGADSAQPDSAQEVPS